MNVNTHFSTPSFMIILSKACQAECRYCFGPHTGDIITKDTIDKIVTYIAQTVNESGQSKVFITFHGGEPLLAPIDLWTYCLEQLSSVLSHKKIYFSLQSNLWKLTKEFCQLFNKYKVSIGTSLDGPEHITNCQRGEGYYEHTYKGIRLAQSFGLEPGIIATFTPESYAQSEQVLSYFIDRKLNFSMHPSIKPLHSQADDTLFLQADDYASLLSTTLRSYVKHRKEVKINSLDELIQSVATATPSICTFQNCFGKFIVLDSNGDIYPCQRLCGQDDYCIGNVTSMPSIKELEKHPNAVSFVKREQQVAKECQPCEHFSYCHGGCLYNAVSQADAGTSKDPYCDAYKRIFTEIKDTLAAEVASSENRAAIKSAGYQINNDPLFFMKSGDMISLLHDPHPSIVAQNAKRIAALYELAANTDITSAAQKLVQKGITKNEGETYNALLQYQKLIENQKQSDYKNNLYVHTSFQCNLQCDHCYAEAACDDPAAFIDLNALNVLLSESIEAGFRQLIITGGEPLIHPEIHALLDIVGTHRNKGSRLVLRTNLTGNISDELLSKISRTFDLVVVSLDGPPAMHNKRRGAGSYESLIENLQKYQTLNSSNKDGAELSLASVMGTDDIKGTPGQWIQDVATDLQIKRIRFRPLLPLGRAAANTNDIALEAINAHIPALDVIKDGIAPRLSCGVGKNIYIDPTGNSYPCYGSHDPAFSIGNVFTNGLAPILESTRFKALQLHTVDSNQKCSVCPYKYICGGACRAWELPITNRDFDTVPADCDALKKRAAEIVEAALLYLKA